MVYTVGFQLLFSLFLTAFSLRDILQMGIAAFKWVEADLIIAVVCQVIEALACCTVLYTIKSTSPRTNPRHWLLPYIIYNMLYFLYMQWWILPSATNPSNYPASVLFYNFDVDRYRVSDVNEELSGSRLLHSDSITYYIYYFQYSTPVSSSPSSTP